MTDLVVIVPSRGRPESIGPLIDAFRATCTAGTHLLVAVDRDDPAYDDYRHVTRTAVSSCIEDMNPSGMVGALNKAARWLTGSVPSLAFGNPSTIREPFAVGFMGDDHCPRTVGWDTAYLDALRELGTGIVYGDDLLQGERIPTQVAMTSDIVRALGYMAPPTLTHLYVDNFWKDLGQRAGCLRYLPDVVVEHVHPYAGKATLDEGYIRVNSASMYERDETAYGLYVAGQLAADAAKVQALRGER